jgi:cytochrome c
MSRTASKTATLVLMSCMALATGVVAAEDGATLYKTKTCFTCHGKDGKTPIMPGYPKIAGQNRDYVRQQMLDIKSGARSNGQSAAMKGVMGLVSEEEIDVLADYISTMQP